MGQDLSHISSTTLISVPALLLHLPIQGRSELGSPGQVPCYSTGVINSSKHSQCLQAKSI